MNKGNSGLTFTFFASLAFIVAFVSGFIPALVVLGFAIAMEKNDWLTKQCTEASLFALFIWLVDTCLYRLDSVMAPAGASGNLFNFIQSGLGIGYIVSGLLHFCAFVLYVAMLVIALMKVSKGMTAGLPVLDGMANRAVGYVTPKPAPAPAPVAPMTPVQQPAPAPNQNQNPQQ